MGALIFAFGGLCFLGLVLICGAYFTSRMHAKWEKEIEQANKQVVEGILEYQHTKEKFDEERRQYNANSRL